MWTPPEWIARMRRRLARRDQLVRARSRVKNELHAVLMRCLKGRAPVSDLFGVKGRDWLRGLKLPDVEDQTVQAGLRHIEFLDFEIEQVERLIARGALESPQIKRLMTAPGVNVSARRSSWPRSATSAGSRVSATWSPTRVLTRASTSQARDPRSGRISKQGSPRARWALVEAARSVVLQPGPLRAFYERLRARKGHNAAVVAVARKLAVRFYCMLTREEEDYAHQQPSLTAQKLRRLEVKAGAPTRPGKPTGVWATREKMRHAEKQLAAQAEASYKRSVADSAGSGDHEEQGGRELVTAGRA